MYTEQDLTKLKKDSIIQLFLKQQDEFSHIEKILEQMSSLNHKVVQLESNMAICSNTSSLLAGRIKHLERQLLASQQYSRRECLDICGIDTAVSDKELENTVCEILSEIEVDLNPERDLQACHRIGRNGNVIVKFSNRKTVSLILSKKKYLQDKRKNVYINESLCPLNRKLRGCCNKLIKEKKIKKLSSRNGMIRIKIYEDSDYINVDHKEILENHFPGFNFSFDNIDMI